MIACILSWNSIPSFGKISIPFSLWIKLFTLIVYFCASLLPAGCVPQNARWRARFYRVTIKTVFIVPLSALLLKQFLIWIFWVFVLMKKLSPNLNDEWLKSLISVNFYMRNSYQFIPTIGPNCYKNKYYQSSMTEDGITKVKTWTLLFALLWWQSVTLCTSHNRRSWVFRPDLQIVHIIWTIDYGWACPHRTTIIRTQHRQKSVIYLSRYI